MRDNNRFESGGADGDTQSPPWPDRQPVVTDPAGLRRGDESRRIAATAPARPRRPRRRLRFALTALVLAAIGGALYYFNYHVKPAAIAQFMAANVPPPTPVATVRAVREDVPQYLEAIGSLKAVHQVTVAPEVEGRVEAILFEAGAKVSEGQPLVKLDDDAEQGELAVYQAQARLAEINLRRAMELYERRTGPRTTVDESQAQLDQARGNIRRMQALIEQKVIEAPFSGQLGVRQIEVGQYLSPGAPIATLTDLSRLYVDFTLPEGTRSQLSIGQAVEIRVDAFRDRTFQAKITAIEPQVSTDTRAILVEATLDNPGEILLPGMFANVRVVLPPLTGMITLPATAVDYSLYGDSVFLVTPAGEDGKGNPLYTVKRTFVETGQRFADKVAIVKGLNEGDLVVASGQIKLHNGATVSLSGSDGLTPPETPPTY
ncbi:MAG: efflux RND transporter periplasmic adaptor subunit [Rhodospirillaceae bacterium]|nr:efflux RND transporter periplasmic adaptor subunit [Rhodospirillaceae bacterium]